MRQRNNPRIRLSTAAVRCRRTFTYHADVQLASASCDGIGRAGAHASSDIASQCSLRSGDMRTPPAAPLPAPSVSSAADDMPAWNLARHRAAVEHVLTRTAISEQSRRIYRELLATGDNCAEVARRMNLPAATVRQVKSRVSRMIAAFEKATE